MRKPVLLALVALSAVLAGCAASTAPGPEPEFQLHRIYTAPGTCTAGAEAGTACVVAEVTVANGAGGEPLDLEAATWNISSMRGNTWTAHFDGAPDTVGPNERATFDIHFEVPPDSSARIRTLTFHSGATEWTQDFVAGHLERYRVEDVVGLEVTSVDPGVEGCPGKTDADVCHEVSVRVQDHHPLGGLPFDEFTWIAIDDNGDEHIGSTPLASVVDTDEGAYYRLAPRFPVPEHRTLETLTLITPWGSDRLTAEVPTYTLPEPSGNEEETVEEGEPPSGSSSQLQHENENISISHEWSYDGTVWTWEYDLRKDVYKAYAGINRTDFSHEYAAFINDPDDDQMMSSLATEIRRVANEEGWPAEKTLNFALRYVQSLPYTNDTVTSGFDEFPRYPVETLVDGGDCEDTSILFASIARELGYEVAFISPPGHMGVGVHTGFMPGDGWHWEEDGKRFYFAETTGEGYDVGDLPKEYHEENATLHDLTPTPILSTPKWQVESSGSQYEVTMNVSNVGPETAENLVLYAALDAGGDQVWSQDRCEAERLRSWYYQRCTVYLDPAPDGERTRLIVAAWADNAWRKTSYSEWYTS